VLSKRVLRRIFGKKRDEVIEGRRKLHNEELHNVYCSPSILRIIKSRRMRLAGHVARVGEKRNTCRVLVGNPEGQRPLERPRRGWEDIIRMDLREIGWGGMDWIDLAEDRDQWRALVSTARKLLSSCATDCFSRRVYMYINDMCTQLCMRKPTTKFWTSDMCCKT
jgi:hypothetical protein